MMLFVRLCLPPVAPVHDGLPAGSPGDHTVIPKGNHVSTVRVSGFPIPAGSWNQWLDPASLARLQPERRAKRSTLW